ncbi:MAG: tyrosine-type recombinase/integrase [Sulfuricurvum sp.]|nr:tyrosine-type recombinase/integrase [Sulfuricurvum sp.]
MSSNKTRGSGNYFVRGDKIWVQGSIDGNFYRKSTGKDNNKVNMTWLLKQKPLQVLSNIIDKKVRLETIDLLNFEKFGYLTLESSSQNRSSDVQADYIRIFKNFILPSFQGFSIDKIKPIDIESWQNAKIFSHLSYYRRTRIRGIMNTIMDKAVKNGSIPTNPVKNADNISKKPAEKKKKVITYSPEEMQLILANSSGWLKVYFILAFTTGMRVGEILGLKWSDFDLEKGVLSLARTRTKGKENGSNDKKDHDRTIALFPNTVKELIQYESNKINEEYLFVSRDGEPWYDGKNIVKFHVKPLFKSIGIPYKTLRSTRASFITIMIDSAVSMSWIQSTVGHSRDSSVTIKYYFNNDTPAEHKKEIANLASQKLDQRLEMAAS